MGDIQDPPVTTQAVEEPSVTQSEITEPKETTDLQQEPKQGQMIPKQRFDKVYYEKKESERQLQKMQAEMEELKQFKQMSEQYLNEQQTSQKKQEFVNRYKEAQENDDYERMASLQADYQEFLYKSANNQQKQPQQQQMKPEQIDAEKAFNEKYGGYANDPAFLERAKQIDNHLYSQYQSQLDTGAMSKAVYYKLLDHELSREIESGNQQLQQHSFTAGLTQSPKQMETTPPKLTAGQQALVDRLISRGVSKEEAYKTFSGSN